MANHITYLDVVALHDEVSIRLGAPPSALRDPRGLESAVMRSRMAELYEGADLIRQGVLLAVGVSQARAFIDGNKRAAFAALRVFLRINGLEFSGRPMELVPQLIDVVERSDSLSVATDRFEEWLRNNVSTPEIR